MSNPLIAISNIVTGICHKLEAFRTVQMSQVKRGGNKPTHIFLNMLKELVVVEV